MELWRRRDSVVIGEQILAFLYRSVSVSYTHLDVYKRQDLREPRRFKVTIFNDDFTTMEFVVKILTTVFFKSTMEADVYKRQPSS